MIPAYNPSKDYLEQMLQGVLDQDPGPEHMQIEVVDDGSPMVDVAVLVREIAGDRVNVYCSPVNHGLAGCWNSCIERARGEWVHILHQDDLVLPGFYNCFELLIQSNQELDAAYSRYLFADADGHWKVISRLEMRVAGELKEFDRMIATSQCVQCAAVVVKRSTYQRLGGYRDDIPYVLDWEMWCRIAAVGRWGYVPQPGAVYREHLQSETERLRRSGKIIPDILAGGKVARSHFPQALQEQTASAFQDMFATYLLKTAAALYANGFLKEAGKMLDSFRREAMIPEHRWTWLWLRFRILIKPLRRMVRDS